MNHILETLQKLDPFLFQIMNTTIIKSHRIPLFNKKNMAKILVYLIQEEKIHTDTNLLLKDISMKKT